MLCKLILKIKKLKKIIIIMENSKKKLKITVLGSANYDFFMKVDRAPEMGETISSNSLVQACGGKGANQAATIGKLEFPVDFVGQLGNDSQGKILKENLDKFGVNTKYLNTIDTFNKVNDFLLAFCSASFLDSEYLLPIKRLIE